MEDQERKDFDDFMMTQASHGIFMGGFTFEEESAAWLIWSASQKTAEDLKSKYDSISRDLYFARRRLAQLEAESDDLKSHSAELSAMRKSHGYDSWTSVIVENQILRKNAGRYEFLRRQHWSDSKLVVVRYPKKSVRIGFSCPSREELDLLIDCEISLESAT